MTNPDEVRRRITLLSGTPEGITAFVLTGESETIIVAFNPGTASSNLSLPEGKWGVFVENNRASSDVLFSVSGEAAVDGISAFIAILKK